MYRFGREQFSEKYICKVIDREDLVVILPQVDQPTLAPPSININLRVKGVIFSPCRPDYQNYHHHRHNFHFYHHYHQ